MKSEIRRKLTSRVFAAALLALVGVMAALLPSLGPVRALQVDQTRIMSKRDLSLQAMHYYRLTVNFNDSNISAAQMFGAIGANSYIYAVDCHVTTAFNASTTNVITFGTTKANANEIVASGISGNPLATGILHLTSALGLGLAATSGGDVTLWVKYVQTGTAATTGAITCVIQFVPNNDL